MNTAITYRYTDASNYKAATTIIVEGLFGRGEIQAIINSCKKDNGDFSFVPEALDLPLNRPGEYDPQIDHPWAFFPADTHENISDTFRATTSNPTVEYTATGLMTAFKDNAGKWDELAEALEKTHDDATDAETTNAPDLNDYPEIQAVALTRSILHSSAKIPKHLYDVLAAQANMMEIALYAHFNLPLPERLKNPENL